MAVKLLIVAVALGVLYALIRNSMKQKAIKEKVEEVNTTNMEKDPVCDTYVEETTQYKLKYYNRVYFFCSQECLDKFKAIKAAEEQK